MKLLIYLGMALVFLSCNGSKEAKKNLPQESKIVIEPSWLKSRPFDGAHYIGIGRVSKSTYPNNYTEEAKKKGLDDLSSEIEVKLESNSILYTFETNSSHKEDFVQSIKLSTKLELENYELVDVFESKDEYAVYYRINKATYLEQKKEREEKAIAASKIWLQRANDAKKLNDWKGEIKNYGFAIGEIQNHFNSVLKTEIQGKTVFYGNYLFGNLQNVVNRLTIVAKDETVRIAYGFKSTKYLTEVTSKLDREIISQIPLVIYNDKQKGMSGVVKTDVKGVGYIPSVRTSKPEQIQLSVKLNVMDILECNELLKSQIASSLNLPTAKILVSSETPKIHLKLSGYKFSNTVQNELEQAIRRQGLLVESESKKADLSFIISTISKEGGEYEGLFTSYLEVTSKVVDRNGKEIYFKKYNDLKGVDLNYIGALNKASQSFSKKFGYEIMPQLKSELTR
ncbi:MAG: LPP20 family lipoprotein [Salibacteraceae bacterium]